MENSTTRAAPTKEERVASHYTVSVSPRGPREVSLLPLPELQGAAVSGELTSQISPPEDVVEPGRSSPPRGSLEQLVRQSPAGPPLQVSELAVQSTPETSLERLVPLVDHLAAWKLLPNVSAWVLRTVEKGYSIQFGAQTPPFDRVLPTLVGPEQALVMEQEVETLLRKEAIEVVPPHDRESGFYSRYFIVPKKDGGLRPIVDLRRLNRSVMRLKFKMLTVKQVVSQVRSEDWFVMIDLKDAYFYVSILSSAQEVPEVCFQGRSIPGIHILNYIDDWLILAESESVTARHQDVVLADMKALGLRLNAKKSVLSPFQRTTYLGVVWDSTTMQARLSPARIESILAAVTRVKEGRSLTVKQFQQLLVAVMSGRPAQGLWSGCHLSWHINCLEMLAIFQALKYFLPDLRDRHVLVRTERLSTTSTNREDKLLLLRAVHVPGHLNVGADVLSRQGPRPGEWMLHPEMVKQIWKVFGPAQVDLFATRENAQCPLWYSLVHPAPLGLDAMVQTWPRLRLYAFPPIALLLGVLERVRRDGVSLLLVSPYWPGQVWFSDLISLLDCSPWEIPVRRDLLSQAGGTTCTPARNCRSFQSSLYEETVCPEGKLFTSWCGEHQQDPVNCPVGTVLEFLQACFSTGLSHSTLKVYVVAILAYHAPLGGLSMGKDPLVTCFLHGVLRLRPPVRPHVPTWDLAVALEALCRPPFEPIEEISVRFLTIKTALLLALTSLKRVEDLQALSVAPSHLDFAPGMTKAFLYPRAGYVPKVPTATPQLVVLQAFCPPPFREPDQQKHNCMCPVRALDAYVHRAAMWRKSDQLFVCYSAPKKGHPATKQTRSRWIVDAISTAYESSDLPSPLGVKAHSTHAMAASKALMLGVPIQDICNAAGWSTPLTFVRFYNLDVRATPGSSVFCPSFFTRQGLRSLVAWACRSPSVFRRSSSS
ncbi:Transposon Tf2-6 polyprotein [Labeo rohita]|uniref:ribonuclease H n=1 Tax=Labeo rohita TaxID=84645 RepID=A0ABQ8LZ87_LABRO|nr:Transposon Tf2-6 polyprotein [Labeo rohita]